MPQVRRSFCCLLLVFACLASAFAQQPEKKVNDPIGDAEAARRAQRNQPQTQVKITAQVGQPETGSLTIDARKQEGEGNVVIYSGEVEAYYNGRYGEIKLFADRLVFNSATNDVTAEGNVYFEQNGEKFVGERFEFNLKTERGSIFNSTGFTNRTPDGTVISIDADRADKTGDDTYNLDNARLTACNDRVPKWSFTAKRARIRVDQRAKVYNALFRIKDVPVFYLPYASISISKKDRSSGFLLPSSGSSNIKGRTLHLAYYQTLGRSADVLVRSDLYSKRGVGMGFDFRARTNETSRVNFGSFLVIDHLLGKQDRRNCATSFDPVKCIDAGGSSFYADAAHYFKNGFVAVADVNITSSFAFRQVFGENILTAISPEERSIFYLNKNWRSYSFNGLFGEQSFFIGRKPRPDAVDDQIIKMRQFPAVELNKRSTKISEKFPAYFSFESSLGGVRRSETRGDDTLLKSPSVVQRLDFFPRLTLPLKPVGGFTLTPSLGLRSTFYSDSIDPVRRQVTGANLFRNYGELHLDLRPPALAKVFRHKDGRPWFKHIIEPYVEYRRIIGIEDFARTLRTDERDTVAETNEVEYGVTNRFYVKRPVGDGQSTQAHEWLDLTIAQKYFFDPTFGGALKSCTPEQFANSACPRHQFFPINTLTGFSFGGLERRLSPLHVRARLRPNDLVFADVRVNYDTTFNGLRELVFGGGFARSIFQVSHSWYYTRRLAVDQARYKVPFDPSSLPGNQFDFSAFVGNPARGPYGGFTTIYDLRDKEFSGLPRPQYRPFINLTTVAGWAWDCCSLQVQSLTFNAGLRDESRFVFAFTLKGIGTFGTQNIGQRR